MAACENSGSQGFLFTSVLLFTSVIFCLRFAFLFAFSIFFVCVFYFFYLRFLFFYLRFLFCLRLSLLGHRMFLIILLSKVGRYFSISSNATVKDALIDVNIGFQL